MTMLKRSPDKDTDFFVRNEGSIFLVTPQDEAAKSHLQESVSPEAQWFGDSLVVEHRYIEGLVEGLEEEGFTVGGF